MVAPTRTPQTRGVKCDLCKKILSTATWLDQTKLAKTVEEAEFVINLLDQHALTECPCIPRNIENLLVGSTHFEVHRLVSRRLDELVHNKQYDFYSKARQKILEDTSKNISKTINDCEDNNKDSRFKLVSDYYDEKKCDIAKCSTKHLEHLVKAVDYWKSAMEDTTSPFNSKLALRLGLTHHGIYACYLFKFYKLLDYQLITANLLLNLFKSIEGVTANAILHANYLLVITYLECGQTLLAQNLLKSLSKNSNYEDKTHYESILLTCASCEFNIMQGVDAYDNLDLLSSLAKLQPDDKLQHYYARTYALSTIIKYIHHFPARSDLCFEFYHTFRYMSAIMRRCYESSFDLALFERDINQSPQCRSDIKKNQILAHSWIRMAVCDFVFSTFDLCSNFYLKSGQPENLQLLYNSLNLIAYKSGSFYWQARMSIVGAKLDLLCDKTKHALAKLDTAAKVIDQSEHPHLINLLHLDLEVNRLNFSLKKNHTIETSLAFTLLQEAKTAQLCIHKDLTRIELYDCDTMTTTSINGVPEFNPNNHIVLSSNTFMHISLECLKALITSKLRSRDSGIVRELITSIANQFKTMDTKTLPYYDCQILLEILILYAGVETTDQILLETIEKSKLFLKYENGMGDMSTQFSKLAIGTERNANPKTKRKTRTSKSKICLPRYSNRRGNYDVARLSSENLCDINNVRYFDTIEAIKNFESLTTEELVVCYLRNSEPNPDYMLYRKAHELMFCFRLKEENIKREQLLYHFCESSTSNTMRYRWMMFEEQHSSPYEQSSTTKTANNLKYLGFSNAIANTENTTKSMIRSIPDNIKLVQLKYIYDKNRMIEHLLIVSFDNQTDPIYFHTKKPLNTDDFFQDAKTQDDQALSLPWQFIKKVEEVRATLSYTNQLLKSEKRDELEKDMGLLLRNLEREWLGPFRFIFCGKTSDPSYGTFVKETLLEMQSIMHQQCSSTETLRLVIENAPLLERDEIRRLLAILFDQSIHSNDVLDCYNRWYKSFNQFVSSCSDARDRIVYFDSLARGQIGLILDNDLEHIPFESMPITRTRQQAIFRIPSLRLFSIIAIKHLTSSSFVDSKQTAYILDPANNLEKTRERFKNKLLCQKEWSGVIGKAPKTDLLEQWLSKKQIYIFIGHGAGTTYYNALCKNRGLSFMPSIKSTSIIMGCSSGRVLSEGPKLESFGISWIFVFRGAPAYLGLLWDVTDTDIDKFLDCLLVKWLGSGWLNEVKESNVAHGETASKSIALTDAVARVRQVCRLKFLIGATPVVYGLPVWCKS